MFSTVAKRLGFSMFALAILVTGAGLIGSDLFPHVPFVIERAPESPAEYSERLAAGWRRHSESGTRTF